MYQKVQCVQSTLFPPMYFDVLISDGDRELLFIDLKLVTHTKSLEHFRKTKIPFEYDVMFFTEVITYRHFLPEI